MWAEGGGWEQILPTPLAAGVGPFAQQGFRHVDVTRADSEVLQMFFAKTGQMFREPLLQGDWQCDYAVPAALAIMNGDGSLAEIQIFDTQAHGFHEAEAAAIHDLGDQFPWIFQTSENGADFLTGHHHGGPSRATGRGDMVEGEFLDSEDVFHEKSHGVERLFLCGGGDVSFQREEIEVGRYGGWTDDFGGLAELEVAEADEPAVPVNVGFLGGDSVSLETDGAAERVDESVEIGLEVAGEGRTGATRFQRRWDDFQRVVRDRLSLRRTGTGCSSHCGESRADLDGLTGEGPVVRFQGACLI